MDLPTYQAYFWEPYESCVAKGLRKKWLQIDTVQPYPALLDLYLFELYLNYFFLKLILGT